MNIVSRKLFPIPQDGGGWKFYNGFQHFASEEDAKADLRERFAAENTAVVSDFYCPKCGTQMRKVGRGGQWNHRYAAVCSCGFEYDPLGLGSADYNSRLDAYLNLSRPEAGSHRDEEQGDDGFTPSRD